MESLQHSGASDKGAIEVISLAESKRLLELEAIVAKGIATFMETGKALAEIRASRLYRVEFKTFEDYCKTKWGFARGNAFDLIETAAAAENVQSIVQNPSRKVVRPLKKLKSPEKQRQAMQAAAKASGGKPTAKHVAAAANAIAGEPFKLEAMPSKRVTYKPSNGLQYADMALANLAKIHPNDTERKTAFAKVEEYIRSRLEKQARTRGSYADWQQFRAACETITGLCGKLDALKVDADHRIQARDLAAKLSKRLMAVSNNQ